MIYGPNGQPVNGNGQRDLKKETDVQVQYILKIQQALVDKALRDVCGGIVPSQKKKQKFLRREVYRDGALFYWRGEKLIFIGHHVAKQTPDGKVQLQVPHKPLYLKTPDKPVEPSN